MSSMQNTDQKLKENPEDDVQHYSAGKSDEEGEEDDGDYMQDFYKYENKEDFFQANDGYLDLEEKATQ
jgi:hypothetical protein